MDKKISWTFNFFFQDKQNFTRSSSNDQISVYSNIQSVNTLMPVSRLVVVHPALPLNRLVQTHHHERPAVLGQPFGTLPLDWGLRSVLPAVSVIVYHQQRASGWRFYVLYWKSNVIFDLWRETLMRFMQLVLSFGYTVCLYFKGFYSNEKADRAG